MDCVCFAGVAIEHDNKCENPNLQRQFEENGSPDEIESILRSNWPKVRLEFA